MENNFFVKDLSQKLNTHFIGQKIIYYPSLDSPIEAARREALWGALAGTVTVADHPAGNQNIQESKPSSTQGPLSFCVILRPNTLYLPYIKMLASVSVLNGIRSCTGLRPYIKWPDDILVNEKIVCNIRIESDIRKGKLNHSLVGVLLNVNSYPKNNPDDTPFNLSAINGHAVDRQELFRRCLIEMDTIYKLFPDTQEIFNRWKQNIVTLGHKVLANRDNINYSGVAESLTNEGNLLLRQSDGKLVELIAGETTLQS